MRFVVPLAALALSTLSTLAAADDRADVVAADARLNALIVAHDTTAAAALYADAFVLTTSSGKRKAKGDMLADIAAPALSLTRNETTDADVRVLGDVAVLTGTLYQAGRYGDRAVEATLFVTDTWVRRDGRWVLLAGHASKAP